MNRIGWNTQKFYSCKLYHNFHKYSMNCATIYDTTVFQEISFWAQKNCPGGQKGPKKGQKWKF